VHRVEKFCFLYLERKKIYPKDRARKQNELKIIEEKIIFVLKCVRNPGEKNSESCIQTVIRL
jgi:hypothetical protein